MIGVIFFFTLIVAILIIPAFFGSNKKQLNQIHDSFATRQQQLKSDYQFRRKELLRRLKVEDINQQELSELNDELDRETSSSIEKAKSKSSTGILKPSLLVGLIITLVIVNFAGVNYWNYGNPEFYMEREKLLEMLSQNPSTIAYLSKQAATQKNRESALELLHAARLLIEIKPFSPQSWLQFGEVEASFGRMEIATSAFRKALQLDPKNTEIKLALSRSLLSSEMPNAATEAMQLEKGILRTDPKNRQALLSLGFSAFQAGEYQQAIDAWEQVLEFKQTTPEKAQILHKTIATAKQRLASQTPGSSTPQAINAQKSEKQSSQPAKMASVLVNVSIAADIQSKLSGNEILFVFAKAASGPPIPLAAVRFPINNIPAVIQLSDKNAMRPDLKISSFKDIKLSARISISGNAIAQKGDFEGSTEVISGPFTNQSVKIEINQQR
jgi:cytochrome c-type biogenesis protein CcmH